MIRNKVIRRFDDKKTLKHYKVKPFDHLFLLNRIKGGGWAIEVYLPNG